MPNAESVFPAELGCVVCRHVFEGTRPVKLAAHELDGSWGFYCGDVDHSQDENTEDYKWMKVGLLIDRDDSISDLSSLSRGEEAERKEVGKPWVVTKFEV